VDRAAIENLLMPITYVRHLARRFAIGPLLEGTGLSPADLNDRECRISVRQALRYIDNTRLLASEPDWYLSWAADLSDHFHGSISVALMSAPTLGQGIEVFLRYFPGRVPYLHMQGRRDGAHYYAELHPLIELGASTPLLIETPLIILQQYLDVVYGVDFAHVVMQLAYPPPAYAARYARYVKGAVEFDAPRHALVVPVTWLGLRNLEYSESSWSHALAQCEATLASSRERTTLGEVRRFLCNAFANGARERPLPTLGETATHLHLAPRTLIRRLRELGTTYQTTVDDFLRERARELLANDSAKIKEVAAALGFTNPANFGKAFKRWYGVSPGHFRQRQARDAPVAPRAHTL
jgi:AraC-like DNA-binding protein